MKKYFNRLVFPVVILLEIVIGFTFVNGLFYMQDVRQLQSEYPTDEIRNEIVIGQDFISSENNLSSIEILVDTKDRKNNCTITVDIKDSTTGEIVRSVSKNSRKFIGGTYEEFRFEPIKDSAGKRYILEISSNDSKEGNAIAVMVSDKDEYSGGALINNGIKENKDLRFKTYYSEKRIFRLINVIENGYLNKWITALIIMVVLIYLNILIYLVLDKILGINSRFQQKIFNISENDNKVVKHLKKNKLLYIGFSIVFIYLLPYFLLGENSFILIHDNLDSNVTWYKILAESGKYFSSLDSTILNLIDGLPRNVLGSELFVVRLLYLVFTPFQSYVINQIIMRVIAYIGMILILDMYLEKEKRYISYGVAVCFALLPFWPSAGLSIAGQPLLLWAFLQIRKNGGKWIQWIILPLVAMYSSLVLASSFFLFAVGIIWLRDLFKYKRFNPKFFFALVFTGLCYLVIEYRLVYSMFLGSDYVSHRTEWQLSVLKLKNCIDRTIENFTSGQYQAASLHKYFINATVIISFIIMFLRKKINKKILGTLIILGFISILYGFWEFEGLANIKDSISIFATFRFSRFNWLQATIWHLLFAACLVIITKYITDKIKGENGEKVSKVIVFIMIAGQIIFAFYKSDFNTEFMKNYPTYKEFYAEDLMNEIKEFIGKEQSSYRIVSVGLEPAIAQYNGFYTLDGYLPNYPLEYKHKFRKIIENELNKNEDAQGYYDRWGSKFFVFPSSIFTEFRKNNNNFIITKDSKLELNSLQLNVDALKEMKCSYIMSALPINNVEKNSLELLNVFESDDSIWKIYLYELK